MNDKEYEEISPTAIVTSYPRIFTDIPYEKDIYKLLTEYIGKEIEEVSLNKNLATEIEARYKLTNKLLDKSNIKQVLEIASGYSSRGIIYSQKGYNYIEMDLPKVVDTKKKIVHDLNINNLDNLKIVGGNALRCSDFEKCDSFLNSGEVAIINEGLFRYLTFDEKAAVAKNIYKVLEKHGGIWITCDVTPKKFIQSQNKALPNFNNTLTKTTNRNNMNDRFDDLNHIKSFFGNLGFDVTEVHKFNEVIEELYSINNFGIIDQNIEKSLEDAIVVIMKVKETEIKKRTSS